MALETVGDNCLLRTAGKKPSCPQVFSNSDLLSHNSWQSRAEDYAFSSSSQNPERNCFPSLMVVSPSVFVYLAREKTQGVQGRERVLILGKNGPKSWGKRNLESPYLENSFQRVAKLYPHFSPSDLQPTLAVLLCVMGNPRTLQIRGGGKAACGSLCFWHFFLSWNIQFHPMQRMYYG
jgi:hypothetical protein